MKTTILAICTLMFFLYPSVGTTQNLFHKEIIKTVEGGSLEITFIGHGTLMFTYNQTVIHVDPWSRLTDYSTLPKADIILLTHDHPDHLDLSAIKELRTHATTIVMSKVCSGKVSGGMVMENGQTTPVGGVLIEAVPAYNIVHMRSENVPFHPKGDGNGYVITFGDQRVYVAGDTENVPEMKSLKNIDIAFLPMNLPYTMTPEMVADAAKAFRPRVLYPYHYGESNVNKLVSLLKDEPIKVRIQNMK